MNKIGLLVFLLLLFSTAVTAEFVRPVEASGTIYISSDYTFTSDVYEPVVVTADNIVIDGAGYTVQGAGSGTGIDLSDRNNVTLKNVEVTNFALGILLSNSTNNNITGNSAPNNDYGILLYWFSDNNTITGNTASSNYLVGIHLSRSSNNTVTGNNASNNYYGINLYSSSNNTFTGNTVSSNIDSAIRLRSSSDNNTISGNNVSTNYYGIHLYYSSNNIVSGNTASTNYCGIYLYSSTNNNITGNNASDNNAGIYLDYSSNNAIYHNDFIDNTNQAFVTAGYANIWDDGSGKGNYWSDYEDKYPDAEEIDGSGIWDTPYVIDENNQDNYPIIPEFPTLTSMLLILIGLSVAMAIYKRRLLKTPYQPSK